jgi:hypothetical protein
VATGAATFFAGFSAALGVSMIFGDFIATLRFASATGFGAGFLGMGADFFLAGFAAEAFLTLVALGADFFAAMLRSSNDR